MSNIGIDTEDVSKADVDKAAKELASQRAQKQREQIIEAVRDWVWVSEAYCFVRRSDHMVWTDRQWRAHYAHLKPDGNILDVVLKKRGYLNKYERLIFEPNGDEVIDGTGYNLWRPSGIIAKPGDVTWFTDHVAYMFPDANVCSQVLDFLALLVSEPWVKIRFALLIQGFQHGIGKGALGQVVARILGEHNVRWPSNDEVTGAYTAWQEGTMLGIIDELMMLGRQEVANRLKPIITEPTIRIRPMWRPHYSVPNRINIMAFSNYADAAKIDNPDRRWFVTSTSAKPRADEYYITLFRHIASDDGIAAVKFMLMDRLVMLNPSGRAPATEAKRDMIEQALPDPEAYAIELFEDGAPPFDFDLLRRDDLVDAVQKRFPGFHKDLMARMSKVLKERMGAVVHTRNTTPGDGRKKFRLWSVRNHDHWRDVGPTARQDAYDAHQHAGEWQPSTEDL